MNKLNVLLAKTDSLSTNYKNILKDYIRFFKGSQSAFHGKKSTYEPKDNTIDEPNRRGNDLVQTTVKEKLSYFIRSADDYINSCFDLEKTNSSGLAVAELIVDGDSWGSFTSLELLRLKSFLENGDFKGMYANVPVRSDAIEWTPTSEEMYQGRTIYESPKVVFENKTTEKESYILPDPNLNSANGIKNYVPQVAYKNTTVILGDGTHQNFTGEWSHRERANVLRKIATLHTATIEALKRANDCEVVESQLRAELIFSYIHE